MLRLPGGGTLRLGDGTGPALVARITSAGWAARIAAKPGLGVGEAYMDGGLVLEQGEIVEFIDLIGANAKFKIKKKRPSFPQITPINGEGISDFLRDRQT